MKIYFGGSITGGRQESHNYSQIIKMLSKYGNVLTEHVGKKELSDMGEDGITHENVYERDIRWLKESDLLVADVTVPSLGVGYEIGKAEEYGKPILCLRHRNNERALSKMVSGNKNIRLIEYDGVGELAGPLDSFFKNIRL